MAASVALVTGTGFAEIDTDLPVLAAAAKARQLDPSVVVWDDPGVDWSSFAGVVIRSTWDYVERRDEFVDWAKRVATVTRLANPAGIVEWNSSKRYLRDLAEAGVSTVPTAWVANGDQVPDEWDDLVVKPAVSAGARRTGRYGNDRAAALRFAASLVERGHDVLVQPFIESVGERGEVGVYFFGGEPSHAIAKSSALPVGQQPVEDYTLAVGQVIAGLPLSEAPVEFARSVLEVIPTGAGELLYARVDCVKGSGDADLLLELELIEPNLFTETATGAADRFADALVSWLRA